LPVRLKDIAKDLGVSVVTVSKVLRGHSDISAQTRERVLNRMKELNYRPNLAARALVTGRTSAMGLVVPDLVHPFFAQVAKGVSTVLREHHYSLFIASSEEDEKLERQEIDQLLERRVDALLVASAQPSPEALRRAASQQAPCIFIDRRFPALEGHFIGCDDARVGELATRHLAAQGCRRIAHIRGPEVSTALGRLTGYQRALSALRLPPGPVVVGRTADNAGDVSGAEAMRELLQLDVRPDGVFCYNDPVALGAMTAIFEAGLRIPEDIAVVGCGNVPFDTVLRVPLTSVDQSSEELGARAGRLALELLGARRPAAFETILVEPRLVERASSLRRAGR
jgi:LacI family transcriptional regulator